MGSMDPMAQMHGGGYGGMMGDGGRQRMSMDPEGVYLRLPSLTPN